MIAVGISRRFSTPWWPAPLRRFSVVVQWLGWGLVRGHASDALNNTVFKFGSAGNTVEVNECKMQPVAKKSYLVKL